MKNPKASTRPPSPAELLDLVERAELDAYEAQARRAAIGERVARAMAPSSVKEGYDAFRAASRTTTRITRISKRLQRAAIERWGRR